MNSFAVPKPLDSVVSENDPEFSSKASPGEARAVSIATRDAGLGELPTLPARSSTGEESFRRTHGLKFEKKQEDTGFFQEHKAGVTRKTPHVELFTVNGEARAKYKIEVTFAGPDPLHGYKGRTTQGPNRLGITLWESGKHFHGGGDELMYWCKDNREGEDGGCWSPISGDNITGEIAYCPHCKRTVSAELLTNMKIGNVSTQQLSKDCEKLFRQLGSNADLYLKYHKSDVHYIAMERAKGPEVAARLKGMHIYPLRNIITDTAFGADLTKRFYAFLTS